MKNSESRLYRPQRNAKVRFFQYYVLAALFIFCTALQPFLGEDNRNYLLIGFMFLSPAFVFAQRIPKCHFILYLFMASIVIFPLIVNREYLRWSTVFYSIMFALSFIAYENVLYRSKIDIELVTRAIRFLLMAYLLVLIAQQVAVASGLPILNDINYNPQQKWKLNVLASEPSHAARVVNILMLAYLSLREIRNGSNYSLNQGVCEDRLVWIGYLWLVITMQSATAFVFLPIILSKLLIRRNFAVALIATILVLISLPMIVGEQVERTLSIVVAATSLDYVALIEADHSGSMRVAPLFVLAGMVDLTSLHGWFGHGIDTVSTFMSSYIPGVEEGTTGGGMLMVWYEYGFISFALFIAFTIWVSGALRSITNFIFWLLIVFIAGPNNQVVWMYLILSASVNYFRRSGAAIYRARTT